MSTSGLVDAATAALEARCANSPAVSIPTLLTRAGLAPALTSYFSRLGRPDDLVIDDDVASRRFAERVEVAAYYCCTQAVANASGPSQVRLSCDDDWLRIDLQLTETALLDVEALTDRVEACGGTLEIDDQTWIGFQRRPRGAAAGRARSAFDGGGRFPRLNQPVGPEDALRHVRRRPAVVAVELVLVVGRQQHDDWRGAARALRTRVASMPSMPGRLTSIRTRSGLQFAGDLDRLLAGGCGADDREAVGRLDHRGHGAPKRLLVIDDQDPHFGARYLRSYSPSSLVEDGRKKRASHTLGRSWPHAGQRRRLRAR